MVWKYAGGMTEEKKVMRRKALAKWLKESILRLGPTFIKIGQQFSTRVDILAQEYVDQLSELQVKIDNSREYHYINMFQYSPTWFVSSFWMELLILEKTKCLRWFYMQFIFSFMGCTICVWVYVFVVWCVCMCERNTYLCQYLSAMICLQFSFFMCCISVFGCMHVLYGMCVCMLIGMCFLPVWLLLSIISLISDFFSLYAAGCCNFMEISSEHHLVTIIDEKKIL